MKRLEVAGSYAQQQVWHASALDWGQVQEEMSIPIYQTAIEVAGLNKGKSVLDVGCSTGLFCTMAYRNGSVVAGVDSSSEMLRMAGKRKVSGDFRQGKMERLTWPRDSFDVVTAFDSFPYANTPFTALLEAKRVAKVGGMVVVGTWSRPCECDAAEYLQMLSESMEKDVADSLDPFFITSNCPLEEFVSQAGLTPVGTRDIEWDWVYSDIALAVRGLLSTAPAAKAVEQRGYEEVLHLTRKFLFQYGDGEGGYLLRNKFTCQFAVV